VIELGEGEIKEEAALMLTAIRKLSGEEAEIPDGPRSRRGEALKEALDGRKSTFKPENEIDVMILGLIDDLTAQ
jgi:hypothetical protein